MAMRRGKNKNVLSSSLPIAVFAYSSYNFRGSELKNNIRQKRIQRSFAAVRKPVKEFLEQSVEATLLQDLTQDSATLTGWRRTKRSGEGKMITLYCPGIYCLRYRSFP
jgi:hypothetical protein